jgi:pantoate--beta-alanine ligase
VFVNPLQFGPAEDLDRYPRDLDADLARLAPLLGSDDLVFAPTADEMYPGGEPEVRVQAGPIGSVLEGAARPGHLDGVLTVVLKLTHLTRPDVALFGRKDAQQLAAIRAMVRDLDVSVEVVGVPTVRDPDGLALSSRNAYLTPAGRARALALVGALAAGRAAADSGAGVEQVVAAAWAVLGPAADVVDYVAVVDEDFVPVGPDWHGTGTLALAASIAGTHLIDNTPVRVQAPVGGGPRARIRSAGD